MLQHALLSHCVSFFALTCACDLVLGALAGEVAIIRGCGWERLPYQGGAWLDTWQDRLLTAKTCNCLFLPMHVCFPRGRFNDNLELGRGSIFNVF